MVRFRRFNSSFGWIWILIAIFLMIWNKSFIYNVVSTPKSENDQTIMKEQTTNKSTSTSFTTTTTTTTTPPTSIDYDGIITVLISIPCLSSDIEARFAHRASWIKEIRDGIVVDYEQKKFLWKFEYFFFVGYEKDREEAVYWANMIALENDKFHDIIQLPIYENMNEGKTFDVMKFVFNNITRRKNELYLWVKQDTDTYIYWPNYALYIIPSLIRHFENPEQPFYFYFGRALNFFVGVNAQHCAGGELTGLSMDIVSQILKTFHTPFLLNERTRSGEDIQTCWLIFGIRDKVSGLNETYTECLLDRDGQPNNWVHAKKLKNPQEYWKCHTGTKCLGMEMIFIHPKKYLADSKPIHKIPKLNRGYEFDESIPTHYINVTHGSRKIQSYCEDNPPNNNNNNNNNNNTV